MSSPLQQGKASATRRRRGIVPQLHDLKVIKYNMYKLKLSKILTLILLCSMITANPSLSQEVIEVKTNKPHEKNAIYGSIGYSLLWISFSGYYERIIGAGINEKQVAPLVRVGYVGARGWEHGDHITAEAGIIIGRTLSHLELAAGYHHEVSKSGGYGPFGGSISYRFQEPHGVIIFRFGLGYPEGLFISLGISF